jgi:hypothetical protein
MMLAKQQEMHQLLAEGIQKNATEPRSKL